MQTLTRVFGALFASQIFSVFISPTMYFPGAPFLLAAMLHLSAAVLVEVFFHPLFPAPTFKPTQDPVERQSLIGPGLPPHNSDPNKLADDNEDVVAALPV